MTFLRRLLMLLVVSILPAMAIADIGNPRYIEFKNIGTGNYMDIRGGHIRPGTRLWMWDQNHTDAQLFNPKPVGDNGLYQIYLDRRFQGQTLYLTVSQFPPNTVVDPVLGEVPEKFRVTLAAKIVTPSNATMAVPAAVSWVSRPSDQLWKFEAVPGLPNAYVIRSVGRGNRVLTSAGSTRGSKLLLRPYEDLDSQHWAAEDISVAEPTGVRLRQFRYFPVGELRGDVVWSVRPDLIDYFEIDAASGVFGGLRSEPIGKSEREWKINFVPGLDARNEEFCFRVTAVNRRRGTDIKATSDSVCDVARRNQPQQTTYSKAVIQNCHDARIPIRIWTITSGGAWKDQGLLDSQWQGSGCPLTGVSKSIDLSNGQSMKIIGIDSRCGSSSPDQTQGSCHVLTTPNLPGNSASSNVYSVQIG